MLQGLVKSASQLLSDLNGALQRGRILPRAPAPVLTGPRYQPLQRVLLTDGVGRTLFEEYAAHRTSTRGEEETGWVLLGLREATEAVVLATLPAGALRSAGVAHVQFNSSAQVLGSRIVRQKDRRLLMLGVVHTHPGSLRHPSDADYRGDTQWVGQLRGGEGIFGIGTADGQAVNGTELARQPRPHLQCLGKLCFTWYALGEGDAHYRPLPVGLTLGPDLARALHPVWSTIEAHAERLDRLARQQTGVTFEVADGKHGQALGVTVPLAEPGSQIRVLVEEKEVRYYLQQDEQLMVVDPGPAHVDQGVYLLLAELAAQL